MATTTHGDVVQVAKKSLSTNQRRCREVKRLRAQAITLRKQLGMLRRQEDEGDALVISDRPGVRTMVWRKMVKRQHQMRLASVAENVKLRRLENEMTAVLASMTVYVQRKLAGATTLIEGGRHCDEMGNQFDPTEEFELWTMSDELDHQFARIAQVMATLRKHQELRGGRSYVQQHPLSVESLKSPSIPFCAAFVMRVVWNSLPRVLADEGLTVNRQCGPDAIEMRHRVRVIDPCARSVLVALRTSRRYCTLERTVVVVASRFRVDECESAAIRGAIITHKCWITADDLFQTASGGAASRLRVAATTTFDGRDTDNAVPSLETEHPATAFLEGVLRAEMTSLVQRLENQLLSESRRCSRTSTS